MNKIKILLAFIFLLVQSCDTTEPNNNDITLSVKEVSSTEMWLNLNVTNIGLPVNVEILQDNKPLTDIIILNKIDTVINIDSLFPNRNYNFQAKIYDKISKKVTATTSDTTNHNLSWELYTFGENIAASSHLSDVAIVDENNIWAVGEIYMNDSLGNPDPHLYNVVYWNGNEWEVRKISLLYKGNIITPTLYSIFAFSPTEIWMSS